MTGTGCEKRGRPRPMYIELPEDAGWGDIRAVGRRLHELGYRLEEERGTGPVRLLLYGPGLGH